MDPAWAESGGNRYLLRLFRDYVYHQVGSVWLRCCVCVWCGVL